MPVYHFTYHAHGSWLPDRQGGYVRWHRGVLPTDPAMADRYRRAMKSPEVVFDAAAQRVLVDAALEAGQFQHFHLHAVGTDPSHAHLLVSWKDERGWDAVRPKVKESMSRQLNAALKARRLSAAGYCAEGQPERIDWFCENASRKRVRDRAHFDRLRDTYIPDHPGLKWDERRGTYE